MIRTNRHFFWDALVQLMVHVTLKQLRYFDALAREQHFGRAADACSVTQPALSMQIQDLEASLGIALVERTRGGIKLTPKGEEIAARAQRLLNDVRNLIDYAQHAGGILSGTLRLGVIPSIAPIPAAAIVAAAEREISQRRTLRARDADAAADR